MLRKLVVFAIAILLASAVLAQSQSGQAVDKVFPLTTATEKGRIDLANTVRIVAQVPGPLDSSTQNLTVHGTPTQLAITEWVLGELDRPAPTPSTHKYTVPGASDDIIRIFYPTTPQTPQALQEMVNTIRSIVEVQKISVLFDSKATALRGTANQVAATEWLVNEIDKPPATAPFVHAYRMAGDDRNPVVRVYQLAQTETPQSTQELVNMIRSICELQRVVANNAPRMIVLRGSSDLVAAADWLMGELWHPAAPATAEFRIAGLRDPVVHLVYLTKAQNPQSIQETVNAVRTTAKMQRVVACNAPKLLAMRGTADQMITADQIVKDRNQ